MSFIVSQGNYVLMRGHEGAYPNQLCVVSSGDWEPFSMLCVLSGIIVCVRVCVCVCVCVFIVVFSFLPSPSPSHHS